MCSIMSGTVSPDYPALARRVCDLCAVRDTEGCAGTAALAAASGPSGAAGSLRPSCDCTSACRAAVLRVRARMWSSGRTK